MHNSIEFTTLFYGAAKLGLVAVPLNTRLTASELSFILSDSGTKALFFDPEFAETVEAIKPARSTHSISKPTCRPRTRDWQERTA